MFKKIRPLKDLTPPLLIMAQISFWISLKNYYIDVILYNFLLSFRNIFHTNTLIIATPLTTAVDNSIHIACQSFIQNCLGPKMLLPRSSLMQKRRPCTATLLLNLFREHTIFTYIGDCFNAPCFSGPLLQESNVYILLKEILFTSIYKLIRQWYAYVCMTMPDGLFKRCISFMTFPS